MWTFTCLDEKVKVINNYFYVQPGTTAVTAWDRKASEWSLTGGADMFGCCLVVCINTCKSLLNLMWCYVASWHSGLHNVQLSKIHTLNYTHHQSYFIHLQSLVSYNWRQASSALFLLYYNFFPPKVIILSGWICDKHAICPWCDGLVCFVCFIACSTLVITCINNFPLMCLFKPRAFRFGEVDWREKITVFPIPHSILFRDKL